jgi:hypothetical protein
MNPLPDLGVRNLIAQGIRAVATVLMMLIVTAAGCVAHMHYQAASAVARGADPLGVSCAIHSIEQICALAAARSSKTQ